MKKRKRKRKAKTNYQTLNKRHNIFGLVIIILLSISCSSGQQVNSGESNACVISKSLDVQIENINTNSKVIIKNSEDNCIINLLDSLTRFAIKGNDDKYLSCIESFAKVSDGYVSEYFLEIGAELFYKNFFNSIMYIFKKRYSEDNYLEKVLIEAISMEMSDADDIFSYKKKLNVFIDNEIKKSNYSKEHLEYINLLKSKFDPNLFD